MSNRLKGEIDMIIDNIFSGIGEGIVSGSGELIGSAIIAVVASGYYSRIAKVKKEKIITGESSRESSRINSNERLIEMLRNIGFKENASEVKRKSISTNLDWSVVRGLDIVIDGEKSFSTVGGLLNTVWEALDEDRRIIFLVRVLLGDVKLEINPTKKIQLIASEGVVNDYLLESGNKKSLWGFKKEVFGYNVYFLNQYGYKNAPKLIHIVKSLMKDISKIEIVAVV
jgi:hypothetical protein